MTVRRIVPNLRGIDLEQSKVFYTGFLGLELGMDLGWIVNFGSPNDPAAQLNVLSESRPNAPHPDVTIEVGDVETVYSRAVAQQIEIVYPLTDEEWGVRRFFVRDPNGAILNIMSHSTAGAGRSEND